MPADYIVKNNHTVFNANKIADLEYGAVLSGLSGSRSVVFPLFGVWMIPIFVLIV